MMNRQSFRSLLHKVLLCAGTAALLFTSTVHSQTPTYTEVAQAAGITHQVNFPRTEGAGPFGGQQQGFGSGAAWIDYDNDGDQDVFFSNPQAEPAANSSSWLYRNNGDGTFSDVTSASFPGGFAGSGKHSMGVVAADFDGDGWDDLFLSNGSNTAIDLTANENTLYRNNGDGTFTDVSTAAGIDGPQLWSFSASFGDIDGDGDLDLYVGNYTDVVTGGGTGNNFYVNNGDGTFTERTTETGTANNGAALASVMTDFDQDGDLDIFVINDFGQTILPNTIYRNDGVDTNGIPVFTDAGSAANLDASIFGMGVAVGDYNRDGVLDYYVTNLGDNVLHTGNGDGTFTNQSFGPATSWGTVWADVDKDGYQDLFTVNGWIGTISGCCYLPEKSQMYMNNGDGTFTDVINQLGPAVQSERMDRGLAAADYDEDGDIDLVVMSPGFAELSATIPYSSAPEPARLLRNDTVTSNNWLVVKLNGNNPNHRGIGAKILVQTNSPQLHEVSAGNSHASSNAFPAHFGLGSEVVADVSVTWPSGCTQTFDTVAANQSFQINESECVFTYVISGTVTDSVSGVPVQGVSLVAYNNVGAPAVYAFSDASGNYSFLPQPNGMYIVLATKNGYNVGPAAGNVFQGISDADVTKDYIATFIGYTISGTVTDSITGVPVASTSLVAYNNVGAPAVYATSDASGNYTFPPQPNGMYIILATKDGYNVGPAAGNVFQGINGEDVTKDYIATFIGYTISGTVTDSSTSGPLAGVAITAYNNVGAPSVSAVSNAQGKYTLPPQPNGTYLVMANKAGYNVAPAVGNVFQGITGSSVVKDYVGTPQ